MLLKQLLEVHGHGNCDICGQPRVEIGQNICSYPHGMLPKKDVDVASGMWAWELPRTQSENEDK
jgi:hypothetical protein